MYKEHLKTYHQKWYEKNKEAHLKKSAEYYQANKDKIKQQHKEWRENNKERCKEIATRNRPKYLARRNEKTDCECGGRYSRNNRSTHFKSVKHQNYLQSNITICNS